MGGFGVNPIRILVVDDEPQIPRLIAALLGDAYTVDAVDSAKDAIVRIESHTYDLVLTDLMMPEMDGIELLRRARSRERSWFRSPPAPRWCAPSSAEPAKPRFRRENLLAANRDGFLISRPVGVINDNFTYHSPILV